MNEDHPIEFVLQGKVAGQELHWRMFGRSHIPYEPTYDEAGLDRFAAKGAVAWADIPDAAQWVREVRGG